MPRLRHRLAWTLLALLLPVSALAQRRSDPLNPLEIDQLRDAAQDADTRLKLFVEFARLRLTALEQVRTDPKITNKGDAVHDRLQDFVDVYDELNQNIDTFNDRKADLRKVLKVIIDADTEFQARLRAVKDSAGAGKDEKTYEFVLADAMDDVDTSIGDHRQLLAEQEEAAKRKKEHKH